MKSIKPLATGFAMSVLLLTVAGCSNMSQKDRNTAIGAGAGAVIGNVLTGGSTAGTVGGAAVGGVVGNQVKTKKR